MEDIRKNYKKKKPVFRMQDAHKKARLKQKWRRPKGIQSKIRLHKKGYRRGVEIGWGSPKDLRGKDPKYCLTPIVVHTLKDIHPLDAAKHSILLGKGMGARKKIDLLKLLKERSFKVLNIKDADAFINSASERLAKRKAEREVSKKDKEKKKEELAKEAKKKEEKQKEEKKEETTLDATAEGQESKEQHEKEEKDKVLTQKV
ncbi:hypothetical protein HZB01_03495 [Candidatus Woesearchaeota archaeon]|nr:hypothetical protein [Candidatus Woesearchaeota archaeon]